MSAQYFICEVFNKTKCHAGLAGRVYVSRLATINKLGNVHN